MLKKTNSLIFALLTTAVLMTGCKSSNNIQHATEQSIETPRVSTDRNARAEAYLNEAGRKIRMEIKNGEMSEEEGRAVYAGIAKRVEKRMSQSGDHDKSRKHQDSMRARYQEAADKMAEMVKAGEITREQMEMRLGEMRKRMRKSSEHSSSDAEMRARTWLEQTGREIREALKNGDLTPEEARAKYAEAELRVKERLESKESSPR
tara:strand:- start:52 stop:666 length:615 start_codon:yes stop_codon:yes gene_type:complete